MLCSYGWLLTSSPVRHVRHATTAVTTTPKVATKRPRRPRLPKIDAKPMPGVGLAERQAVLEASLQRVVEQPVKSERKAASKPTRTAESDVMSEKAAIEPAKPKRRTRKPKPKAPTIPPRLLPRAEQKHHDLHSFLAHAARSGLNIASTVYRGTHFEYTVAAALQALNFTLQRTGRSNDLGIDLIGHWSLPPPSGYTTTGKVRGKEKSPDLSVLLQCKAARATPSMIRELEGAYTGAPAGWRGDNVLALLANVHPSTKGVREAVQRSRWPLGVLQVTREGEVKQFLWNAVAAEAGLQGLGVAVRYASKRGGLLKEDSGEDPGAGVYGGTIGLTWLGQLWRPAGAQKDGAADALPMN